MPTVIYQGGSSGATAGINKKLVQIKPGDGWYENGSLVTSYATNGNSDVWTWHPTSNGIIYGLNGCGGGGGGGAGSNNGASAGAGGGGGAAAQCITGLIFPVFAGNTIKFTLGAKGAGGVVGVSAATAGGNTKIEHSGINPYECGFTTGGSLGTGALWNISGGAAGVNASAGTKGVGGGFAYGTNSSYGSVTVYYTAPITSYWNLGAAGGDAGSSGSYVQGPNFPNYILTGTTSNFYKTGGSAANSAGGGGAGAGSYFGPGTTGGAGQAQGTAATGYGTGGAGGGGGRANQTDAANGRDGTTGYVEFWYEVI